MIKRAIYKVPNGKLLKIFLDENNGIINNIKITGDFFAYPEEHIEELEKCLIKAIIEEKVLTQKLEDCLKKHPTQLYGIDIPALTHTILEAAKS